VIGGCCNCISYYSANSSIIGGYCNRLYYSSCSTILGGYDNRIRGYYNNNSRGSSIVGGIYNKICYEVSNSAIIGGCSNEICCASCHSTIVGGCNNGIYCYSINSSIIGGCNNCMFCSCNSVILGGQNLNVCEKDNTVFLNATTNFRQTVEFSGSGTVSTSPFSINFEEGAIKYINSISTDFQVNFTNVPVEANSAITYTLILNQSASAYMITDLTINGGGVETIKWANGNTPDGTADQVDIIGLMFVYDETAALVQVLGQVGTYA
jgi:hypothetical protein